MTYEEYEDFLPKANRRPIVELLDNDELTDNKMVWYGAPVQPCDLDEAIGLGGS